MSFPLSFLFPSNATLSLEVSFVWVLFHDPAVPKAFPLSLCHHSPSIHAFLCNIDVFNYLLISLSLLSTEWYLVRAVLLCRIQGNEPHAVHWLWPAGPGESFRHLAHHAEYDCRRDLLRCFYWPRNSAYPVPGLLQTAVSGKGEELH